MFVSKPEDGHIYFAKRILKRPRFLWSIIPMAPGLPASRIDAGMVPKRIRKQAYNQFWEERS